VRDGSADGSADGGGGTPDGFVPSDAPFDGDAGADVAVDAPPEASTACTTTLAGADVAFCEDFDTGQLHPTWTLPSETSLIALVTTQATSVPYALRAQTTDAKDALIANNRNESQLPDPTARVFEASVRLEASSGGSGGSSPLVLGLHALGTLVQVQLRAPTTATAVCVRLGGIVPGGEITFTANAWHRVKLSITSAGVVSCDIDGIVRSETLTLPDPGSKAVLLRTGLLTTANQGPVTVLVDDVVYRRQ
jgi:hypothetical protein